MTDTSDTSMQGLQVHDAARDEPGPTVNSTVQGNNASVSRPIPEECKVVHTTGGAVTPLFGCLEDDWEWNNDEHAYVSKHRNEPKMHWTCKDLKDYRNMLLSKRCSHVGNCRCGRKFFIRVYPATGNTKCPVCAKVKPANVREE